MNAARKSLLLLTLVLAATVCVAELVALEATVGLSPDTSAVTAAPLARNEAIAQAAGRRCDSLDSFGNPVRPCRA
jgi:hypothetical protein